MQAQPGAKIEPHNGEPRPGATQVTKRTAEWSPRFKARMAGVFEFLEGFFLFRTIESPRCFIDQFRRWLARNGDYSEQVFQAIYERKGRRFKIKEDIGRGRQG